MIFIFSRCCLFLVSMQTCGRMSGKEGRGGDGAFVQVFCPKSQTVSLQCVPAGRCRELEGCKCWKSAAFHPVPVALENLFFGFLGAPSSSSSYPAALHPCFLSCGFAGGASPLSSLSLFCSWGLVECCEDSHCPAALGRSPSGLSPPEGSSSTRGSNQFVFFCLPRTLVFWFKYPPNNSQTKKIWGNRGLGTTRASGEWWKSVGVWCGSEPCLC